MVDAKPHPERSLAVALVVAPQFSYLSLAILMDGLRVANRTGADPAFDWTIAAATEEPVPSSSGPAVTPMTTLADLPFAPIGIVLTAYEPEAACTPELLTWLRRQDRQGAIIGCVDTGALVLSRAGLVRGERIAVHPEVVSPFREAIGEAVLLDRRFAFEGRRLSSAGGIATMDMLLALIEKTQGSGLARRVSEVMMFDAAPTEFTRPGLGTGGVYGIDPRLGRMIAIMRDHIETPIGIADVCARARVEPSTARRLFQRRIGRTPSAYYLRLRLERARTLLSYSHLAVAEIAMAVGFVDAASFSHAFKRVYGLPPSHARHDSAGL